MDTRFPQLRAALRRGPHAALFPIRDAHLSHWGPSGTRYPDPRSKRRPEIPRPHRQPAIERIATGNGGPMVLSMSRRRLSFVDRLPNNRIMRCPRMMAM